MKLYLIVAVCVAVGLRADLAPAQRDEWELFKTKFNKSYATREEETQRRANFEVSLRIIKRHNSQANSGISSYTMAINHMADWSAGERAQLSGLRVEMPFEAPDAGQTAEFVGELRRQDPSSVPASVDWSKDPSRVSKVRSQGYECGSCWAFATVGLLEGQQVAQTNSSSLVPLSVQNLVDCSFANDGCKGGSVPLALEDVAVSGGIMSEEDYPYMGKDGTCMLDKKRVVMTVAGYSVLKNITEVQLAEVIAKYGPVAVGIYSPKELQYHGRGVFSHPDCERAPRRHAVLIVGYGTDPKQGDYWIIKNSWGTGWGDAGYFRLKRGSDECRMLRAPTIARF